MKKVISVLSALSIGLIVGTGVVKANEGSLSLVNGSVQCEGVSLWRESVYRVSGRCQGLVYPYETQYEHYVAWAKLENGEVTKIGEVDRGYFEGNVKEPYKIVVITAEQDGSPRRASTKEVLSGQVDAFTIETAGQALAPQATPAPVENTDATMTVQSDLPATTGVTVGSVIGKILKSLLIIIGVIILVAVGASLVFRRRGSVSA